MQQYYYTTYYIYRWGNTSAGYVLFTICFVKYFFLHHSHKYVGSSLMGDFPVVVFLPDKRRGFPDGYRKRSDKRRGLPDASKRKWMR